MYQFALKIHRLFHKMAQGNRAIGNALPGGLSLVQEQLLVELDADKERSLRDLEALLKLDQSSISRIAAGLEERGFIRRLSDPNDGRRYILQLTAAARNVISAIDRFADNRLKLLCSALSSQELRDLKRYFEMLGDGLGEPRGIPRASEHPIRVEQRRLARAVGLLSDSYMQSGLAVSTWHLLSEICSSREALHIKSISERLGLAKNSISTLVAVLEKKGIVTKELNSEDARSVYVVATAKGQELFAGLERKAAQLIELALAKFSHEEAQRFCDLLRNFVQAGDSSLSELLAKGEFDYASTERERAAARSFLVLEGVRTTDAIYLPEKLFAKDQVNVIFTLKNEFKAVFHFEKKGTRFYITCAGWQ